MGKTAAWACALALVMILAACEGGSDVLAAAGLPTDGSAGGAEPSVGPDEARAGGEAVGGDGPSERPVGSEHRTEVYGGLGTWIDIYDMAVWERPARAVRSMAAHGVRTAYLQTSNFSRGRPFVHPEATSAFLDAAARHDVAVVAWYLPGFRDVSLDLRRILAAIRFETDRGNRFDSFALDIESPEVRRPRVRTARLLALSARLRRAVGDDYPLGAIVPSPRGVRYATWYWPTFPWRRLARTYDVFLPMTYFTWRVRGRDGAAWYTRQNVTIIRQETSGMQVPIHVIGGISFEASGPETRGFVDTVTERKVIGASYYTYPGITREQWKALRPLARDGGRAVGPG